MQITHINQIINIMNNIIINQTDGIRPPPIPPTNNTEDNETLAVTAYWDTTNGVLP